MNYRHIYMLIIEHAKSEEKLGIRAKGNGNYYERHHILPKSLFPLWEKRKSNLVLLTAREHFFCHQLLTKIYPNSNMFLALWYLINDGQNNYIAKNSKEYEKIKLKCYQNGLFNSFKGKTHTKEVREKIRNSQLGENNNMFGKHWYTNGKENICQDICPLGFYPGKFIEYDKREKYSHIKNIGKHWYNNGTEETLSFECPTGFKSGRITSPNKGKNFSKEVREKISKNHKGKILSEEHKIKISKALKGKHQKKRKYHHYTMTEEHKKLLSEIRKNKNLHWYTNGKKNICCDKCPEGFWPGRTIKVNMDIEN